MNNDTLTPIPGGDGFTVHIHYDKALEDAVLGACMLEQTAFGRIHSLIEDKVFYQLDNQTLFTVLKTMYDNSVPIDLLSVHNFMANTSARLYEPNIAWYLAGLTNKVCSTSNLEYHCHLLYDMWRRRELVKLKNAPNQSDDIHQQIKAITENLNTLQGREYKQDWYTMDELMYDLMIHQRDISDGTKEFITTGFKAIDKVNGGFSGGQLIVVGARPAVGKSALMGKMALAMALKGKSVGIVSLEMNNTEIAARLASLETDYDFNTIYRNLFRDSNDSARFYNIISKHTILKPVYVSSKTKVDVAEIKSKALKLKYQHGIDCLMVDYLQLVDGSSSNKNYNREQEVSKISRGLKLLAMEMNIPVIVLCQLNRSSTQTKDPKHRYPQLHNLRESGAIEQDADIVAMLHRDWLAGFLEDEHGGSTENQADLLWLKWRNGATLHLQLDFDPPKMKFSEKPFSNFKPVTIEPEEEQDPF